ncbi:hypothetical protein M4951_16645 [Blastopirellula sp. J2-11]|uniref:hypothetical protein n=1 Tax=Blastopirellula sp. J2-11 TaxID=2943192 RepID=UPI0021C7265A|nr:hypothetical protein [Blastopirellula sp. J2-11]UUO05008.1 hypothetical protein M4951_16645 [Blastopirellula sp. J2-11]
MASIWVDCRGGKQRDEPLFCLARTVTWWSLAAFALAMLLGAVNGLLIWASGDREFFSALLRFWETKIFFGWWELAFYGACVGGFLLWRSLRPVATRWERIVSRILLLLAGTNLLYHFPPLFSVIQMLAREDGAAGPTIDSSEFRRLMATPQVIWLSVHFLLASTAVTGMLTARLALWRLEASIADPIVARSSLAALIATLLQLPIGTAFLLALPAGEQRSLMGSDMVATGLFVVAMLSALWLMHVLAAAAFFQRTSRQVNQALATLFGVIVLMTAAMLVSRL